jgi:cold shock CspA family protein
MLKAMLFVDADWLCASTLDLGESLGRSDLQIDYRRLSGVLAEEIGRREHIGAIDVVRSHFFASRPRSHGERDQAFGRRRREFLARLEEEPRIELEVVDADSGGRPTGRDDDRTAAGVASAHVAMTVAAMRYALTPGALDLAIFVLGDQSFTPLLRELRRLGRRVALASIEGSCARDLADPADPHRICDFEVLWLNQLTGRIEKRRGRRPARPWEDAGPPSDGEAGASLRGRIKNVIWERGYGFIAADDGRDYFFHVNALEAGLEFDELQPDLAVSFEVKSGPVGGRAGAARLVRRDAAARDRGAAEVEGRDAEAPAPQRPLPEAPGADGAPEPADEVGANAPPPADEGLEPAEAAAEERRS